MQFTVYRNPGRSPLIPFVLQIQSSRLNRAAARVVMPLVRCDAAAPPDHPLTPHLRVLGEAVYANPMDPATVAATLLKQGLAILPEPDQDRIIRAIDEMISRAGNGRPPHAPDQTEDGGSGGLGGL